MFRCISHLTIENSSFPNAAETLWNCDHVRLRNVDLSGVDYVFMNGADIEIDAMKLAGNYSFQDVRNIVIRNSEISSKDAFWGSQNVTIHDVVLDGEYLGWHSKNLRLVNCAVRGEQPLCYASGFVMENCRMDETDLAFEIFDGAGGCDHRDPQCEEPERGTDPCPQHRRELYRSEPLQDRNGSSQRSLKHDLRFRHSHSPPWHRFLQMERVRRSRKPAHVGRGHGFPHRPGRHRGAAAARCARYLRLCPRSRCLLRGAGELVPASPRSHDRAANGCCARRASCTRSRPSCAR